MTVLIKTLHTIFNKLFLFSDVIDFTQYSRELKKKLNSLFYKYLGICFEI